MIRRVCGAVLFVSAFILPFVIFPYLPDRMISATAFSYGMQGPAFGLGMPLIVLMIQGLRMWHGEE